MGIIFLRLWIYVIMVDGFDNLQLVANSNLISDKADILNGSILNILGLYNRILLRSGRFENVPAHLLHPFAFSLCLRPPRPRRGGATLPSGGGAVAAYVADHRPCSLSLSLLLLSHGCGGVGHGLGGHAEAGDHLFSHDRVHDGARRNPNACTSEERGSLVLGVLSIVVENIILLPGNVPSPLPLGVGIGWEGSP